MAADRKPYHRGCVKCFQCRVQLNPMTLNENKEQLFCNSCYESIFNPSEFTVGDYGGIITPEDIERYNNPYVYNVSPRPVDDTIII
jgi:hypothetical protein